MFANINAIVFFISGIYYKEYDDRIKSSKIIFILWIILRCLTFIFNSVLINQFKLVNYFLWLIGYNAYF